jgi:hypothetical protein
MGAPFVVADDSTTMVLDRGELIGEIAISKPPGEPLKHGLSPIQVCHWNVVLRDKRKGRPKAPDPEAPKDAKVILARAVRRSR